MKHSAKTILVSGLVGLFMGLMIGFIPEHSASSKLSDQVASLTQQNQTLHSSLTLSNFAVKAASLSEEADKNNYTVASNEASGLFTDLRKFVDTSSDANLKQQLGDVLSMRDSTIAALAKADPAVKQPLLDIFAKLHSIQMQASNK